MSRDHSRSPRGGASEEALSLVVDRERARQAKDFDEADRLRDQLQAMGVVLQDKSKTWTAQDGKVRRIPAWQELDGAASLEDASSSGIVGSIDASDGSDAHIKQVVSARERARANKDFDQADNYRDELKAMGVDIYDKEKMWRCPASGTSGVVLGFRADQIPTELEITTLVVQREKARQGNNFTEADMIRDELKQRGVSIFDKDKFWKTTDGRQGPVPIWDIAMAVGTSASGRQLHASNGAVRAGGFAVGAAHGRGAPDIQTQIIQAAMVNAQNPAVAARTLQLLQQANPQTAGVGRVAGVGVRHVGGGVAIGGAGKKLGPEAQSALEFCKQTQSSGRSPADDDIEWLMSVREKCRQKSDFSSSDVLRDAMRGIGIDIFEKEKRWQTRDGRAGNVPQWDTLL